MKARTKVLTLTAALIAAAALTATSAQAFIYYPVGTAWGRANLDGSHSNNSFIENGRSLGESDGTHLWWIRGGTSNEFELPNQDGGVDVSNLDGSGLHEIVSGVAPGDVQAGGGFVYFTRYTGDHEVIARVNPDGSGLNLNFIDVPAWSDSSDGGPDRILVGGGFIYWYDHNRIGRANLDGSGVTDHFIDGTGGGLELGFGTDGSHFYWDLNYSMGVGSIARVNIDGSGMNKNFISGLSLPQGVGVVDGHIYWTQGAPTDRSIRRANLDGSHIQTLLKVKTAWLLVDALGSTGGGGSNSGKKKCTVPSLAGTTLKKARAKLRRAHCSPGKVSRKKAGGKPGRVLATRPGAGAKLPRGAKVALTVSRR